MESRCDLVGSARPSPLDLEARTVAGTLPPAGIYMCGTEIDEISSGGDVASGVPPTREVTWSLPETIDNGHSLGIKLTLS